MRLQELKVMSYELENDDYASITLERIYGIGCERWGIRRLGSALCKTDFDGWYLFILEPIPSSRDDEYYSDHRFSSAEKALEFWVSNRSKIVATQKEKRIYAIQNRG